MNKKTLAPKQLFLIDGLGAMLSALLLGVVLARFETTFGMPLKALYFLSCLACVYAVYSFLSYWRIRENWRPYMQAIAIANLFYCCLTMGLVIYHRQELTKLGLLYFLLEVVVIIGLIIMELKTVSEFLGEKV
jgi:CHASE2 domain-containing sensor protein